LNSRSLQIAAFLIVLTGILIPAVRAEVYIWVDQNDIRHISNVKPKWWTEEMDQMDPGTVVEPEDASAVPGKFIGDRENKKFHWPKCEQIYNQEGLLAIPEHKRIWFETYDEAIALGYHVCDHCKPSKNGPEYQPENP